MSSCSDWQPLPGHGHSIQAHRHAQAHHHASTAAAHAASPGTWLLKVGGCEVQPGQKGVRIRRTDPTAPVSQQMAAGAILLSFDGVDIANDGAALHALHQSEGRQSHAGADLRFCTAILHSGRLWPVALPVSACALQGCPCSPSPTSLATHGLARKYWLLCFWQHVWHPVLWSTWQRCCPRCSMLFHCPDEHEQGARHEMK